MFQELMYIWPDLVLTHPMWVFPAFGKTAYVLISAQLIILRLLVPRLSMFQAPMCMWRDICTNAANLNVACYWENGIRTDLNPIDITKNAAALSMYVSSADVYVGGRSINSSNVFVPCYWKNGTRTDLSKIDNTKFGLSESIFLSGTDVYVAGYTYNVATIPVPCYWKNGTRTDLSVIDNTKAGYARSVYVSGADVYQAGISINTAGLEIPCYWKNGVRTDLNTGIAGQANFILINN